jgi:glycosyltransferase involved in cell wall biosynthesis
MNVLIATGLYPPDIGGPATYTKFMERHLPAQGIELTVVSFSAVRKYPKIIRHVVYLLKLLWSGRKADVLYALDTVSVGVPAGIASVLLRKKLFLRVPGDYAWEQGQQRCGVTDTLDDFLVKKEKPFSVRALAWLQWRVAQHATKIIVPSEYMKTVVVAWGIRPEKIVRVYSAVHSIAVSESKEVLRIRFGYENFTVLTAARLVPWKGIVALIDAVGLLHKRGIYATLEIVGEGTERTSLESHTQKRGVAAYVHFRGAVHKQELAERIHAADVFALNTSYEGLSHQLLEVMDAGVPIITTSVGGNTELITQGVEGVLVPFNNVEEIVGAIQNVYEKPDDARRRAERAREKAKLFREDVIIPEIVKLFS